MIAIIPARGGSKGVPRKNIKELNGKPLIAYTIEAALKANSIHRIIVTTEDEEIADVAKEYGAEVPFMRPAELAGDHSKAQDVYIHAVEYLRDIENEDISKFMVLLATAPFRSAEYIDDAIEVFNQVHPKTLISVKEVVTPLSWLVVRDSNKRIKSAGFDTDSYAGNRQDNKKYYVPNGAIYILDYELLKEKGTYFCDDTYGYLMGEDVSIDIDSFSEFEYAEYIMKRNMKE